MKKIVYIGRHEAFHKKLTDRPDLEVHQVPNVVAFDKCVKELKGIDMVLCDYRLKGLDGRGIFNLYKEESHYYKIPFAMILPAGSDKLLRRELLREGFTELYFTDTDGEVIAERVDFLKAMLKTRLAKKITVPHQEYQIPQGKRLFDVTVAALALIIVSPVLLLTCLAIKLESKGPVLYVSKRVGTGYRVFNFYKFRSMYVDADKRLESMKDYNQYTKEDTGKEKKRGFRDPSPSITLIYKDGRKMDEQEYLEIKKRQQAGTFMKFKNDPRSTKVGKFLRNTSIDELPQLFNVLKGDMSIVGNRPLPLYEAEQLTSDDWGERFLAPAGITGLWQVSRRGRGRMSEEERKALDNQYARNVSLRNDVSLILRTIPALFQKENV